MGKNNSESRTDDKILDVRDNVKWVGVLDYDIVTFDIVMHTEFGTTYNSYFIDSGKKTIIEGVKEKFAGVQLSKIRRLTDPAEIKYIVLDHTEPDHSGSTAMLLEAAPDATVVGSGTAIRYLSDILNKPFRSLIVKDGDTLDIGGRTLRFISAPNLHWPDTMFTYLVEDKILFTCDMFGAHYCTPEMITDFSDDYIKSFTYYYDVILKPFSRFALNAVDKIKSLPVDVICPGHGPIHLEGSEEIVSMTSRFASKYLSLTSVKEIKNVLITYISAYGFTMKMAEHIAVGVSENQRMRVKLLDIENLAPGEIESELVLADALLVGSPTINQNTLLPVYKLFSVVNPLRDRSKPAASFGSYGWSGEATRIISETLRNLKFKVFADQASYKFFPGEGKETELKEYGKKFADYVISECDAK
jgi:flavorubredoxin